LKPWEKHCTCCVAWKHPISSELQGCENNELEAKNLHGAKRHNTGEEIDGEEGKKLIGEGEEIEGEEREEGKKWIGGEGEE
jgi:hypothetical protein